MTTEHLRDWQARMGYTYDTAAQALGMSRSGYAKMLAGHTQIERRTALACAAIAQGVKPWPWFPRACGDRPTKGGVGKTTLAVSPCIRG